jgi:hypothetical protein
MWNILDPTIPLAREHINYVPRPRSLEGLRMGLIENTKRNAEAVLRGIAGELATLHGMQIEVLVRKPQRAPLTGGQLSQLKGRADFVITGVGD